MNRLDIRFLIWIVGAICAIGASGLSSPGVQAQLATESVAKTRTETRSLSKDENRPDAPPTQNLATDKKRFEFNKQGGVVYRKTKRYELKCDLYIPEGRGPFPAILAVHGGAWRHGSKFALLRHAWEMAQSGYVVVAINYRHAPEYPFPAQIHDCKHAVRWMKSNATQFKIDSSRIGAFGYSAGGHLVSLLGTSDESSGLEGPIESGLEKYDSRINAVAAGGAPCEFSWIDRESRALVYWLGGTRKEQAKRYRAASPTTYVTSDDPPFFFFHGDSDLLVPVDSTSKMHGLLLKSNVSSEHWIAKGGGHLGTFSDLNWMRKAIEFFDANLKKQ